MAKSDQRRNQNSTGAPRGRRLFDLRSLIGGVLIVYGVVLVIVGFTDGHAELDHADGIRINLWVGLAMLAAGFLFLLWERFGGEDSRTTGSQTDILREEANLPDEDNVPDDDSNSQS